MKFYSLFSILALALFQFGCSGVNLGDIDEQVDSREEMPGPGIFADESGESALTWRSDSSSQEVAANSTQDAAPAAAAGGAAAISDEQAEFEQYKRWQALRSEGEDSDEYREFQQWLEYQKFKSGQ